MWMKKANSNNLIALLYGPCELETEINNMPVKIIENTSYPFSDNIEFTIQCGSVIKFPITFRKPFKCKNVVVDVSRNARIEENDEQLTIHHTWKDGDKINIRFNFIVHKKLQPKSKTVKNKGIYLQRGPLVYALPFETKKKKTKEHKSSGFYRYKVKAINKNGWQSRMNINDYFEFRPLKINQTDFPWDNPVVSLKGPLIDKNGNKTNVDLVPMGNTIFRRVTFSRYENNKKNIEQ